MKKPKKEKTPPTKQQLLANDPRWEKVFNFRLNNEHEKAEELKIEILKDYENS